MLTIMTLDKFPSKIYYLLLTILFKFYCSLNFTWLPRGQFWGTARGTTLLTRRSITGLILQNQAPVGV